MLDRFTYWDSFHFTRIAERGYLPPGLPCCDQAFFPGYPLAIRVLSPLTGGNAMLAGILISLAASTVAAVMLWQLAIAQGLGPRVAATAVVLLGVAPYGIFLAAVYSEALFLAVTVAAWWAAVTRRWWLAGALAAAATAVRVNGMFLVAALAVMYLVQLREDRRRRPRADLLALALPFAVLAAYFGYLRARTGAWNAWQAAQDAGLGAAHGVALDRAARGLGRHRVGGQPRPGRVPLGRPALRRRRPAAPRRAAVAATVGRGDVHRPECGRAGLLHDDHLRAALHVDVVPGLPAACPGRAPSRLGLAARRRTGPVPSPHGRPGPDLLRTTVGELNQ